MKKKSLILVFLTFIALLVSFSSVKAKADVVGLKDSQYASIGGAEEATFAQNGSTAGLAAWGQRVVYTNKLHLDGLTVKIATDTTLGSGQVVFGFVIGNHNQIYFDSSSYAFTAWKGLFTQTRVATAANHDYSGATIAYTDEDCTAQAFVADGHIITNEVNGAGFEVSYSKVEGKDSYKVTVKAIGTDLNPIGSVIWGNNPNYNEADLSTSYYIKGETVAKMTDENGDCYVAFCGFNNIDGSALKCYFNVEDNGIRNYNTTSVAPAQAKVEAYKNAANGLNSAYVSVAGWGDRLATTNPVKVDGLKVAFSTPNNDAAGNFCFGVAFGESNQVYFDSSKTAVTLWQGIYGAASQTRVVTGPNHDYNASASNFYTDEALTVQGFIANNQLVLNNIEGAEGMELSFTKLESGVYKVVFRPVDTDFNTISDYMWGNNPNYGAEISSTLYISGDKLGVNESGEVYLAFCGFGQSANVYFEVTTAEGVLGTSEYSALANATVVTGASNDEAFQACMTARKAAVQAVNELNSREKAELTLAIESIDELLKTNAVVQQKIVAPVNAKIEAIGTTYSSFIADESTITTEAYNEYKTAIADAKADYEGVKAMLNETVIATMDDAFSGVAYKADYVKAVKWVYDYEEMVEALNPEAETIGEDIKAVKGVRGAYAESAIEAIVNDMTEADKALIEGRIAAADSNLELKETAAQGGVKEAYLNSFEETITETLSTSYSEITAAFEAYENLTKNTTITEEDGELYTKYTKLVDDMYTALETFIYNQIEKVSTRLDETFERISDFDGVRTSYKQISLALLSDERAATQLINTAYNELTTKIENNVWYYLQATQLQSCTQTEDGISFSQKPEFPSRINYNQALDMTQGIKVVLKFDEIAFFNGDLKEDGSSKGANNLCINFLSQKGSYKSMGQGLNIIIWLFEVESNVQVVNNKDIAIGNVTIETPMTGGTLTIEVKHGDYYDFASDETYSAYVIKVNGQSIVIADSVVAANELEIADACYFSFGSFADTKDKNNEFTLVSINDKEFAAKNDDPTDPVGPGTSTVAPTTTAGNTTTAPSSTTTEGGNASGAPAKKGCKKSLSLGLAFIPTAVAVCALSLKKRKEQE